MNDDDVLETLNNLAAFTYGAYKASDNPAFYSIYKNLRGLINDINYNLSNGEKNER